MENWDLIEKSKGHIDWSCFYRFKENEKSDFMITRSEYEEVKYEIYLFSRTFSNFSLPHEKLVKMLADTFPGEVNGLTGYGFCITTNDLWVLYEWMERMKDMLENLYEEYAMKGKTTRERFWDLY